MQLRLFRHFVPVSVVLLASSDALLITGAFYQLLSSSEVGTPIVLGASSFSAQFSAGLSVATVTTMLSVGLYGDSMNTVSQFDFADDLEGRKVNNANIVAATIPDVKQILGCYGRSA